MTIRRGSQIRIFVHLASGLCARQWADNFGKKKILGINEQLPYGYFRANSMDCIVQYAESSDHWRIIKMIQLGLRLITGFDFIHAWNNRRKILDADVIWTHTESQFLAVSLLLLLFRQHQAPYVIGQSIWLFDEWAKLSVIKRTCFSRLISRVNVLTVLSPCNLIMAKQIFPQKRTELILFGINSDEMIRRKHRKIVNPIRIAALGNDRHRDWDSLVAAVGSHAFCVLKIASRSIRKNLIERHSNIRIVRPTSNIELYELYDWADVVVVPLKRNLHASGITVIQEATIRGVPVVCTDVGGLRAYFSDDEVRYVPPSDPAALLFTILQLAEDDGVHEMVKRAQDRMGCPGLSSLSYVNRHVELSKELVCFSDKLEGDPGC